MQFWILQMEIILTKNKISEQIGVWQLKGSIGKGNCFAYTFKWGVGGMKGGYILLSVIVVATSNSISRNESH